MLSWPPVIILDNRISLQLTMYMEKSFADRDVKYMGLCIVGISGYNILVLPEQLIFQKKAPYFKHN